MLSNSAIVLEGVTSTAPTSGTSAYKGVSLNRGSNRWEARIRIRGRSGARNVYLGSFVDEIAAARAFDAAVLSLHGDSHPMNFSADDVRDTQAPPNCPIFYDSHLSTSTLMIVCGE